MEIFKLFGTIFLKDEDAQGKLDKIDKKAAGLGATLGNMGGAALKAGAVIGAAATAAGGALFALVTQTSEAASAINDMSVRTGLSTKTLQELKFASEQVGVNFDSITGAVGKLTKAMDGAAGGSKEMVESFAALNINVKDSSGNLRKMDDVFPEVLKKLAGMKNETQRNALAMKLFGKGAMELVPLLAQGEDGIDELTKKAHDLGLVMSQEAIEANDKFGDTLDAVTSALKAVGMQLGTATLPAFQKLLDWVLANMPQIQAGIKTVFDTVGAVISFFTTNIFPKVQEQFTNLATVVVPMVQQAFDFIVNTILPPFIQVFTFIFTEIIPKFGAAFQQWMPIILDIMQKLWDGIKIILELLVKGFEFAWPHIQGIVRIAVDAMTGIVGGVIKTLQGVINFISGVFTGDWGKAWQGIQQIFGGAWEAITATAKGAINLIIEGMNFLIRGMNKIKITVPDWVYGIGGKSWGINIDEIPKLAQGGEIEESGRVIVGEKAPEILDLPKGARVTPLEKISDSKTVTNNFNIAKMEVRNDNDIKLVAEQLYKLQRQRGRGQGVFAT